MGRSTTVGAAQRVSYEPLFNAFSVGASGDPLPPGAGDATAVTGLFERRSFNSDSSASLDHQWSRRDSTAFSYAYGVRQFTEDDLGDSVLRTRRRLATGGRWQTGSGPWRITGT